MVGKPERITARRAAIGMGMVRQRRVHNSMQAGKRDTSLKGRRRCRQTMKTPPPLTPLHRPGRPLRREGGCEEQGGPATASRHERGPERPGGCLRQAEGDSLLLACHDGALRPVLLNCMREGDGSTTACGQYGRDYNRMEPWSGRGVAGWRIEYGRERRVNRRQLRYWRMSTSAASGCETRTFVLAQSGDDPCERRYQTPPRTCCRGARTGGRSKTSWGYGRRRGSVSGPGVRRVRSEIGATL